MASNTDTSSTGQPTPSDGSITGIRLYLQPEDESLIIGLCNVGEQLATIDPVKAESLRREVLDMIRERLQVECL